MEIVEIFLIFTSLAVTITTSQESAERVILEPSLRNDSPYNEQLVNLDELTGVDKDDQISLRSRVTDDVVQTVESEAQSARSDEPLLNEEDLLYRHDIPTSLVQLLQSSRESVKKIEEDCICHKRVTGVPVSKHINPEGDDLQRVVVYFYSKKGDPNVQLYIPDVQKQHYIPDLPLQDHDLLQPLESDVLLNLFIDSPYSVTKTYFDTRPDYTVKTEVQPDVDEFRRILNQLLISKPRTFETLIRIIQSRTPQPSRNKLLTVLHSLGLSWDELLDQLQNNNERGEFNDGYGQVEVTSYDPHENHIFEVPSHESYSVKVEPLFQSHTVQTPFQVLVHEDPTYQEHKIVLPTYQVHNDVELVPYYEGNFVPVQQPQEEHFLPSFVDPQEHNGPVPALPTDLPGFTLPVFLPLSEKGPFLSPYQETVQFLTSRDNLPVPKPTHLPQYKPQPESQLSYTEYPEFDPYNFLPPRDNLPVPTHLPQYKPQPESQLSYTEYPEFDPYSDPQTQVNPTSKYPTGYEETKYPTLAPYYDDHILPNVALHPINEEIKYPTLTPNYGDYILPTGVPPTGNEEVKYPTLTPEYYDYILPNEISPSGDHQKPFHSAVNLPDPFINYPVTYRPTFDKYPTNSDESNLLNSGQRWPPDNEDDILIPLRPDLYNEKYLDQLHPLGPNVQPPFLDYQYYDSSSNSDEFIGAWPNPKVLKKGENGKYPDNNPLGVHPVTSEENYPADGRFSYPQNQDDPYAIWSNPWENSYPPNQDNLLPSGDNYPWQDPDPPNQDDPIADWNKYPWEEPDPPNQDDPIAVWNNYPWENPDAPNHYDPFPNGGKYPWEDPYPPNQHDPHPNGGKYPLYPLRFPVCDVNNNDEKSFIHNNPSNKDFAVSLEPQSYDPENDDQSNSNRPNSQLQLDPQSPLSSVFWEQGRPQYKEEYSQQPNLVLTEQLRKLLLQPQRLNLIIKFLKELRSRPDYVINHTVIQQPGQIELTLLQQLLNPEYSYEIQTNQQPRIPEHFTDPTFEKWFQGQVVDLGDKFGEVNVDSLKVLIEGILRDHNLMFTKEGVLINKLGNTLNIGELKLRPILIGNSVDVGIKTLLEDALNKKIKIAHDSPYLHGLLVSLGTPPHVLGLVPLGYKSPNGKLLFSDNSSNKPETQGDFLGDHHESHALGPLESQIQELEGLHDGVNVPWALPGQSKVYSWTSPIQTIRYRPQMIRKTFKNVPLDKTRFQQFFANLKLNGLSNFETSNSLMEQFGKGSNLEQGLYDGDLNENFVPPSVGPAGYYPTRGTPVNPWPSLKGPQFGSSGVGTLSLNTGLPSLNAYGDRGLDFGVNLDSRSNRIDLGQLRSILGSLPNLVTSNAQAGVNAEAQLNDVADLVLSRSANLGVPGVQMNEDLGADVKASLDGLSSSRSDASIDLRSKLKVPAGVGKDFEFTEYPVEQTHAAADAPEFRIIGGNPATGSGTPLSNKGKSGPVVL